MWALAIVFPRPLGNGFSSMSYRYEPVLIQALVPELAVEALDISVLLRLPGLNEVQLQSLPVSPLVECLVGELPYSFREAGHHEEIDSRKIDFMLRYSLDVSE